MIFRHDVLNYMTTMVYGFANKHTPDYDMTMTIEYSHAHFSAHGWLSKKKLKVGDFIKLYKYLKDTIRIDHMVFKTTTKFPNAYLKGIPSLGGTIVEVKPITTFNGFTGQAMEVRL